MSDGEYTRRTLLRQAAATAGAGAIAIVAIENQCTPDRTTAVRSVCKSFQLLL